MARSDSPAVLIVDDNLDKLVALESILLELNVTIVKANSGQEALRRLLNEDFAVILLDVRMPIMDGFETAALIRQRPRTARTPIIFITAFGDETHVARGYRLRAVDYLLAPIVPDVLRTKVEVLADLYRSTAEVHRQADSIRQRALQLRRLSTASLQLNSADSIEGILRLAVEHARDILSADWAFARAETPQHGELRAMEGTRGAREPDATEANLIATACTTNRTQRTAGVLDTTWNVLAVPLCSREGQGLGALAVRGGETAGFTQEDEDLLVQLSHMTALAIENTLHREARETDRLKDEFLATVSHELRTPLSAMLSWVWMLKRGKLDATTSTKAIEAIERNAQAQARLVDDLLDVSRIITGKLKLTRRPVELATVATAAIEAVAAEAQAKGVTLARTIDAEGGRVLGDADRLRQVVLNLLSNAIKFTPRGGLVEVRVELDGTEGRVHVRDTGAGIAAEFLPHVFERFRQADSSSTRKVGGLGLGLAIVRHLVEMHGGRVAAESDGVDQGSTFTVTLPLADRLATRVVSVPPPGVVTAVTAPASLAALRVLVVEDEVDAREALSLMLTTAGADVVTAGDAREAFQAIGRDRPDLLVCDIGLPGEDGYSFLARVRAMPPEEGGDIPAVALTAYARGIDRAHALAAGFAAHIAKPFEPHQLLEVLANLAAGARRPLPEAVSGCAVVT